MTINKTDLIKELRTLTQAGMKDCKDALEETRWDLQAAVDAVKAKGLNNTSRNAGKVAAEGRLVIVKNTSGTEATMVEVNCQTDFVGNSDGFKAYVDIVGSVFAISDIYNFRGDLSTLQYKSDDSVMSNLEHARKEIMSTTKENVVVRRWFRVDTGKNSKVVTYLHGNAKLGVIVSLEASTPEIALSSRFVEFGEEVAMQIAAMNPIAVSREHLPPEDVERQKAIFEVQLTELNKPQAAWPKIMEGKLNKWYQEVCLMDQESVMFPKTTIKSNLDSLSQELGGNIKINSFVRAAVGDGIEKKTEDLAQAVNDAISASGGN